jgi:hypothetical protein
MNARDKRDRHHLLCTYVLVCEKKRIGIFCAHAHVYSYVRRCKKKCPRLSECASGREKVSGVYGDRRGLSLATTQLKARTTQLVFLRDEESVPNHLIILIIVIIFII